MQNKLCHVQMIEVLAQLKDLLMQSFHCNHFVLLCSHNSTKVTGKRLAAVFTSSVFMHFTPNLKRWL